MTSGGEEALVLIVVTNYYYIASGVFDPSFRLYQARPEYSGAVR